MDQPEAPRRDRTVEPAPQREVERRRAAQAEQMDEVGGTPTTPSLPKPMFAGAAKGAVIGAIVGAIILTPLALAPILDLPVMARLAICWIAGAAAGATMGAVFGGGAQAEAENPENEEYIYAEGPNERRDGPGLD
jgi:predicted phage tail protein